MSAHGLKPAFNDSASYRSWRMTWREVYKRVSREITAKKLLVKAYQRYFAEWEQAIRESNSLVEPSAEFRTNLARLSGNASKLAGYQRDLIKERAVARKLMMLLDEGKERWKRILTMHADLETQNASFPLDLGVCKNIDFHFNKGHSEFPFLPLWVIRAKGKSYYVNEVASDVPWTTRERETSSTKGVIRFARGHIVIDKDGIARISANILIDEMEMTA